MSTLEQTRKARPAREWASERVFRPLAQRLVNPAARLGLRPESVVMLHTALGLLAAWQIAHGRSFVSARLAPALLLQLKTVLDGLDGQLARATGQTSETGRYLDTEMDVVVNAALLTALLGRRKGAAATLLLSLILSTDYLWEREYREARGEVFRDASAERGGGTLLSALKLAYRAYFVPQEQVLGTVFSVRLKRVAGDEPRPADRLAYTPLLAGQVATNLGLSTQLLALGAALLLGRPGLYAASLPFQAGALVALQLWREGEVRRH